MKFIDIEKEEDLKMIAEKDPVMGNAADRLREVSEDQKTRMMLQSIRRRESDERIRRMVEREEGLQQGIERGIQQGIQQGIEKGRAEAQADIDRIKAEADKAKAEVAQLRAEMERLCNGKR